MVQIDQYFGRNVLLGIVAGIVGTFAMNGVIPIWDELVTTDPSVKDDYLDFLGIALGPGVVFGLAMMVLIVSVNRLIGPLGLLFIVGSPFIYALAINISLELTGNVADFTSAAAVQIGVIGGAVGGGALFCVAGAFLKREMAHVLIATGGAAIAGIVAMLAFKFSGDTGVHQLVPYLLLHSIWQGAFFGLYGALMR